MTTADTDFAPLQPFDGFPDLPGFDSFYGIPTCDIGDAQAMVILGHVGTLRALAAFRARLRSLGRTVPGVEDELGDLDSARKHVERVWAVKLERYHNLDDRMWMIEWGVRPDTPGAFPVTVWRG